MNNYMLLSRLETDCKYYLKQGNRNIKHLYYKDVDEHINEMLKLYDGLQDKPEWITRQDILNYRNEMR